MASDARLAGSERKSISEILSNRTKPFDEEDEETARKRRRTSTSGSPTSRSPNNAEEVDTATHSDLDMSNDNLGNVTNKNRATSPKTPEPQSSSVQYSSSPVPPSSSKVTLNLKHAGSEIGNQIPSMETNTSKMLWSTDEDVVRQSVEIAGGVPIKDAASDTGFPKPPSTAPPSPSATEEESVTEAGDSINGDNESPSDSNVAPKDPTLSFPFRDADEPILDTLHRIINHIATEESINPTVLDNVQMWLNRYAHFIKHANAAMLSNSYQLYDEFWRNFPELISALMNRQPVIINSPMLRDSAANIYSGFAKLSAAMVMMDCRSLDDVDFESVTEDTVPELSSLRYLFYLHNILVPENSSTSDGILFTPTKFFQGGFSSHILRTFRNTMGGDLGCLSDLALKLVALATTLPKFIEWLSPVSMLIAAFVKDVRARTIGNSDQEAEIQIAQAYHLFQVLSNCLISAIEKDTTSLIAENIQKQIASLTRILRVGIQSQNPQAIASVESYSEQHASIPAKYVPDAIVSEWRLTLLARLVKCSQMQMRVMAITTICSDLIQLWKSINELDEDESIFPLQILGEQIYQIDIIDYIISGNCHPEIVSESAHIFGFLIIAKLYKKNDLDLLWKGITSNQDPRMVDALIRMIASISNLFDYPSLLILCEKLEMIPLANFSPATKTLWENVVREIIFKVRQSGLSITFEPFQLCYKIIREASETSPVDGGGGGFKYPDLQILAVQKLKELCENCSDGQRRQDLYFACIEDIRHNRSTIGALWCLYVAMRPGVTHEIRHLSEHHEFIKLIVGELEHAARNSKLGGLVPILSGKVNLPRRDIIINLLISCPGSIDNDVGSRLWSTLIGPGSSSDEDRTAGWQILVNADIGSTDGNQFIQTCFSEYLGSLPAVFFCDGTLDFVKARILSALNQTRDDNEDQDPMLSAGVEQLWQIVLGTSDNKLADRAISVLTEDIYLESQVMQKYPSIKSRQVHLSLVNRCLQVMKATSQNIRSVSHDEDTVAIVAPEPANQIERQQFVRSLKLMRVFMAKYRLKPNFSIPDLRSFIPSAPEGFQGEPAGLLYQSFNGGKNTEVKPLDIGVENTAADLLAILKEETGFPNYRVFYRGGPFVPRETDICKSLADLQMQDGLILVKKDENQQPVPACTRAGSSPLEIEILTHFGELWNYLSMEENVAKEIYHFLKHIPADGYVMRLIEDASITYGDLFPPSQPFRSLYVAYAIAEHNRHSRARSVAENDASDGASNDQSMRSRSMDLVIQAISDERLMEQTPRQWRSTVMNALMDTLKKLLNETEGGWANSGASAELNALSPTRLIDILNGTPNSIDSEASQSLVANTFASLLQVGYTHREFWVKATEDERFSKLILKLCLLDKRQPVRLVTAEMIKSIVGLEVANVKEVSLQDESFQPLPLGVYFWSAMFAGLRQAAKRGEESREFFFAFHALTLTIYGCCHSRIPTDELFILLVELLNEHQCIEKIEEENPLDVVLSGLVLLTHLCARLDESLLDSKLLPTTFVQDLLWKHLFPRKGRSDEQNPTHVTFNTLTRSKLYELIFQYAKRDDDAFKDLLIELKGLTPTARSKDELCLNDLEFDMERTSLIKDACGYVGMLNLSNTCYLNSLMTQLFMNTGFRRFILSCEAKEPEDAQKLLFGTQKIFGHMQNTVAKFINPLSFVKSIETYDGSVIDESIQMDVDEFYNLLFDRWESQMPSAGDKKKLRSFYGGQLVQQIKSRECEHVSERLEPFSAIQCDIKGKSSLVESLQAYVDGEVMDGDNKYKCSSCDRHVEAVKRACLKEIPDNLIFHLKRFDFNLRTLRRSKINDHFSFPKAIDMHPYTIDHLSGASESDKEDIFELVGVLVHVGTAESGHYYSFIKERHTLSNQAKWIEFNDDRVSDWDPSAMADSTFGGPERSAIYETNGITYDKTNSAYMLFYQRSSSILADQNALEDQLKSNLPSFQMDSQLQRQITDENIATIRRHCLQDETHIDMVKCCLHHGTSSQIPAAGGSGGGDSFSLDDAMALHETHGLALDTAFSFLEQISARQKDLSSAFMLIESLFMVVKECKYCAVAIYQYFVRYPQVFGCLVQRNPDPRIRVYVGKMLLNILNIMAQSLPEFYEGTYCLSEDSTDEFGEGLLHVDIRGTVQTEIVKIFDHMWKFFHSTIWSWDEYFQLMTEFALLGDREVAALLDSNYLVKVVRIISADSMLNIPNNYTRMLANINRRGSSKPVSYESVLRFIDVLMRNLAPKLDSGGEFIVDDLGDRKNYSQTPLPWTAEEVNETHDHPTEPDTSHFVNRLLGLDQHAAMTSRILARLVKTGPTMDLKVCNTLIKATQGDITEPLDPFLQGASVYLHSTSSTENARRLIHHICSEAKNFHSSEASAFIGFVQASLSISTEGREEDIASLRWYCLQMMPLWVPYLLAHLDSQIRSDVERLIDESLFTPLSGPDDNMGDLEADTDTDADADPDAVRLMSSMVMQVSGSCCFFLQSAFISTRTPILRDIATAILRLVERCRVYLEESSVINESELEQLEDTGKEIMEALRELVVDKMDDENVSDWDDSVLSSDHMENILEASLADVDDIDELNML